ncbi:MAG: hypothetical protein ACPLPR_06825 [Bacillota bacterium]
MYYVGHDVRPSKLIELCRDMIRTPSLSGQEEGMVKLISQAMLDLGYHEVRLVDRFGNVVGRISFARPGKRVLFEGHMDYVGVGDC